MFALIKKYIKKRKIRKHLAELLRYALKGGNQEEIRVVSEYIIDERKKYGIKGTL